MDLMYAYLHMVRQAVAKRILYKVPNRILDLFLNLFRNFLKLSKEWREMIIIQLA